MKKALFALSLLVVAPMSASEVLAQDTTPVIPATEEVVAAPAVQDAAVQVEAPVTSVENKNLFVKGCDKIKNGVSFVKNGVVYSVVSVKDGIVYGYDKVTGTVERFTPQMILNARDSVRGVIASYPLTAVALTAFVSVKAAEYFSASSDEENEDDSF